MLGFLEKFEKILLSIACILLLSNCGSGLCPIRNSAGVCLSGSYGSGFVAPSGLIDTSFGTSAAGYTNTNFGHTDAYGAGTCIDSSGKIIVVGQTTSVANTDFTIARFTATGVLDTTFGASGGYTRSNFGGYEHLTRCTPLSNGKILVLGLSTSTVNFHTLRYSSSGILDTTYGTAGNSGVDFYGGTDNSDGFTVLSDGSIVVSGYATNGIMELALAKLDSSGALTGFGTVSYDYAGFSQRGFTVIELSNGSFLQVGGVQPNGVQSYTAVMRYTSSGVLDTTFGSAGYATTTFAGGGLETSTDMALQSTGKIITCGRSQSGGINFGIARFTTDGILDSSFGTAGRINQDFGSTQSDICVKILIQPDDKIIAVGTATIAGNPRIGLARYTANGVLDTTFGTGGLFTTNLGNLWTSIAAISAAQKTTGEIVIGMGASIGGNNQFVVTQIK